MATNLYEVLGLNRHASQEEIRKAYRRKALETHPDRLPQNASAADKAASEEMFRRINNAYEVLNDPASRKIYDEQGVWPPRAPQPNGRPSEWDSFNGPSFGNPFFSDPFLDPFSTRGRSDPFSAFGFGRTPFRGFTDPFVLFNSIFGDIHRAFSEDSYFNDPFDRPFLGGFASPFSLLTASPFGVPRGNMQSISSSSRGMLSGGNGRWTSETWTTQTINGVTQTKCVRKDSEGNEHVIFKLPDGTVRRMVNGIEQPSGNDRQAIEYPSARDSTYAQPPPPYEAAAGAPPVQPRASHSPRDPRSSSTFHEHTFPRLGS
ncbi:DnaJ domain-containing protein [Pisolithus thermaeus]|nr:DnaJ domain-containing protein [Pisolithus thermaeus]